MRMSCNGCRVLRKGCSESCILRPCLEWIRSAEAQANATVFLAKFYGRSGLMKLLNSGPNHLRPVIFRSLLYEACGRIINPIYGSVGLQWSGNWHSCQAAVESVLKGQSLQMEGTSDIKPSPSTLIDSILTDRPLKLRNRSRFKRSQHRKSTTHLEKLDDTTDSQVYNLKCQKEFESMFQVIQEENQMKEENQKKANNDKKVATNYPVQNIVKAEANVELEQFQEVGNGVEEMFQSNEMEIFGDDSHGREIDENDVELELRLGSPTSHEAVQTLTDFKKSPTSHEAVQTLTDFKKSPTSHEAVQTLTDFKMSQRHWSSHQNGCKDHPLPNFTSLSLALS